MKDWYYLAAGTLLFALVVLLPDTYILRLATMLCMYVVLAMSWNFIGGLAGYPSFATAAFFGIGAYVSAISQAHALPMILSWFIAGLVAALFSALLGLPILRLKGHYFAIASLALVEISREVINTGGDLTGGGMGMNLPFLTQSPEAQAQMFYLAMLALAVLVTVVAILVNHGRLGFAFRCIQQNEDAAVVIGVDARLYKTIAFVLSAIFTAMAGAIYGNWVQYIEPSDVFDIMHSIKPLVMVLLGGLGTLFGPILGAFSFLFLEELVWRNFLTFHGAVLGLLITLLVLFLPNGITSRIKHRLNKSRRSST